MKSANETTVAREQRDKRSANGSEKYQYVAIV